jgi:hypothetical protein
MIARALRLTVGLAFALVLVVLAVETVWRRRSSAHEAGTDLEAAYRRHPKTRPTVELHRPMGWSVAAAEPRPWYPGP